MPTTMLLLSVVAVLLVASRQGDAVKCLHMTSNMLTKEQMTPDKWSKTLEDCKKNGEKAKIDPAKQGLECEYRECGDQAGGNMSKPRCIIHAQRANVKDKWKISMGCHSNKTPEMPENYDQNTEDKLNTYFTCTTEKCNEHKAAEFDPNVVKTPGPVTPPPPGRKTTKEGRGKGTTSKGNKDDESDSTLYIVLGCVGGAVVIIIVLVVVVVVRRRNAAKKAEEAGEEEEEEADTKDEEGPLKKAAAAPKPPAATMLEEEDVEPVDLTQPIIAPEAPPADKSSGSSSSGSSSGSGSSSSSASDK